jgi:hypothetical protein
MAIIPVKPVETDFEGENQTDESENSVTRRTFGRYNGSRRTFGKNYPSRRTFGRYSGSRRTFGKTYPSRRTFGMNHP